MEILYFAILRYKSGVPLREIGCLPDRRQEGSVIQTVAFTNSLRGKRKAMMRVKEGSSVTSHIRTWRPCAFLSPIHAMVRNVRSYGDDAHGDNAEINSAIAALKPSDMVLFPCTTNSTYLTTSQLTINVTDVIVDGYSCAIIPNTASGTVMVIGGSCDGNPN